MQATRLHAQRHACPSDRHAARRPIRRSLLARFRRRPLSCLLLPLFAVGASSPAWAEEEPMLAPVVVEEDGDSASWKDRRGTPIAQREAMPDSVEAAQVLTHEDIQALRPADVYDLIEQSLGMTMWRQGARVHNFARSRGGEVAIVLDGVYLTSTEAQRALGDLPVNLVESITFVRDASVLTLTPVMGFGAAASSPNQGALLIKTFRPAQAKATGEVKFSYGSYDTWTASGAARQSWQDGRFALGAGYQRSQSGGKSDWNNAYGNNAYLLNGRWKESDFSAEFSLYANHGEREIQRHTGVATTGTSKWPTSGPTPDGVLDKNIWKYDPMNTEVMTLNLTRQWDARNSTVLTLGRTQVDGTQYAYSTIKDKSSVSGSDFKDSSSDINLIHTIADTRNTFKAGFQRLGYYLRKEGSDTPREEEVYGLYFTDEYRITPAWSVDAAYRQDRKHVTKGGDKYGSDGSTLLLSDDTWTDKAQMFSLGTAWQINPVYRVSGRYAFSRTPTPDTITTVADSALPAERLQRWELGLEGRFSRAFQATLTPFYYVIKNAKVSDTSNTIEVYNEDTGEYESLSVYKAEDRIRNGLELALRGSFCDGEWSYQVGWSHFRDNKGDSDSQEIPENRYTARVDWRRGLWKTSLSLLKVDPYDSYGYTVGDYTTANLNVSRKFSHDVTVSLYGRNIGDVHYGTNNKGYPLSAAWGVLRDVGATYGIEVGVEFK